MSIVRRALTGVVAAIFAVGLTAPSVVPAFAAPDDAEFTTFTKSVTPPDTSPYEAGEKFSYTISLTCNSPIVDICVGAQVSDTLPAPLVFDPAVPNPVVVSPSTGSAVTVNGSDVVVDFTQTGTAGTGLTTGQQVNITVFVQVPADVSADFDGEITNTADATAENALPKEAPATVILDIPEVLDSTVVKSVDDNVPDGQSIPSLPDQPVDYTIGGGNASNRSVDTVVVQDPADGTASPYDEYLDFTGITSIAPPPGADQVQIEYQDPDGNWVVAYPTGPIPTDFTDIPDVEPLSVVKGLRFTFSSSTGQIPPTPPGQEAAIGISSETNDGVLDIPLDESVTVPNTASSIVTVDDRSTDPETADGEVVISNSGPTVDIEKSFADPVLLAGDSTTATIESTNGGRPVTSMVIEEPTPGSPSLADQGLTFDGFGDITWPQNATNATVTYTYTDGATETLETTDVNTLPAPTGDVAGFTVTFTGPIEPNSTAEIPFDVTAQSVPGQADIVSTNDATSTVTDTTGQTGTDEASADVTRQPVRISTVIDKNIVRDEAWAVPGSPTDVTFLASVNDQGENASTIGATDLTISDPADPQPGDPPSQFWNTFDARQITAGVPADANLTVQYWNGEEWVTIPGAELIAGPTTWTYSVPADLQDDVQGIRFIYTPQAPAKTLPPGFQVAPTISVATRENFRDGSGSVEDAAQAADPLVVANDASSTVNPADDTPEDNTATAGDQIDVNPLNPDDGVLQLEKTWLEENVNAFSDDRRTARVSWSTEGVPFDTVALTDDPTAGADFSDIAASAFDAWDLAVIEEIDGTVDPAMAYDRISVVELYDGDAGGWTDITADVCGAADTTGTSCDGAFPGYELTETQRDTTLAVRLTYAEGSARGGAGEPPMGTGVAPSYDFERNLDLTFELRETKRSDGGPVVGSLHDETYNSGQNGVVTNTVDITGDGPVPISQDAADDITILDTVINTSISKTFDQDTLPVPPESASQADYPLVSATLFATNETEASVAELRVDDPAAIPAPPIPPPPATTTYDYLNLSSIDSISVPAEATLSTVTLTREGGATTDYTIDEASALTAAELADVIGFTVVHTDPDGVSILSQESTAVVLTFQLREFLRSQPSVRPTEGDIVDNVASSSASRPGGDPALDEAYATDDDSLTFAPAEYGVNAGKGISPASRYEDEPSDGYTVTIGGQPTGNVRTTVLTLTDDEPTFWNAFEFASFPVATLPPNLGQIRVSALAGVDYAIDGGTGALVQTCAGSTDLTACWLVGEWQDVAADRTVTPALPDGAVPTDVRGLRFEVRRDAEETNWEQPRNPIVTFAFLADRLENLQYGPNGEIDAYPVPSTLPGLETAPGEPVQGTTTDVVDVNGVGSWETPGGTVWEADAAASDTTQLLHRVNSISVTKSPGNGSGGSAAQQFPPASPIPYTMTITNTGEWAMTGLELTDQVATDAEGSYLVADPDADPVFAFALTDAEGNALPTDGFTGELDETTGVVTITVPEGFVFNPGDVLVITAQLEFRAALPPGTPVGNTITATSDRDFETCEHTSNNVDAPDTQNVAECAADTTVTPAPAAPIGIVKAVKGTGAGVPGVDPSDPNYDDLGVLNTAADPSAVACAAPNGGGGYYVNECVPITRPGGVETWRISFTNRGNVPADSIAGIDVLPAVGDTGVVVGSPRGSQWQPVFIGNVVVPPVGTATAYYMASVPNQACNAADIQYSTLGQPIPETDPCFADVSTRPWIEYDETTPPAELATARALKLVFDYPEGGGLPPGATGTVTFDTRTPAIVPDAYDDGLPIAWNTVAAGSRATFESQEIYQGPVEPVRAGVAVPTGEVQLQKSQVAPASWTFPLPDSYQFDVQCDSLEEPVDLVDTDGAPVSPIDVPADGSLVAVGTGTNLPLFSGCTVSELFAQGSTVTYDPEGTADRSGEVIATRDLTGRTDIHHPFPPDPVEEITLQVTNTYQIGGFSVSKEVERSTAVDQDGNEIAFDPEFMFEASCIFLGEEVIPEDEREFALGEGDSVDFGPLPVGADCTVNETDAAGSTSTEIVVTEDGTAGEPIDGASASFTILPDEQDGTHLTTLAVTNTYTVGGLEITKDVTGAGAADWAPDSFEVRLVCEWDEATTNPVYDDVVTIAAGETVTIEDLPTGASCTVTEPDDGGATGEPVITPAQPVVVGVDGAEGDPIAVTVTNDFRVGGFQIEKEITGPGVPLTDGTVFTFTYVCTYEGATVGEGTLTITGDGTAGPLVSNSVTGLPVNSVCVITETDDGGADGTPEPVTVSIPDELEGVAQVEVADIENPFSAGTIAVTKELNGTAAEVPEIAGATYTVHVTCALTADGDPIFDGDVQVTGESTVTVIDPATGEPLLLPLGTHCWGEETDDAGATESSVDFDSFDNAAIVVAADGEEPQTLELTATNTFEFSEVSIVKDVTGNAAHAEGVTFEILVTCTFKRGDGNPPIVVYDQEPVELEDGELVTLFEVPIGSECWAEEPDGQGAYEIEISATEQNPVVVTGGANPITIIVTNVFPDAGFTVKKTVDNGGAVNQDGTPIAYDTVFSFTATCEFQGETVLDESFELTDGGTQTFDQLPAGSDCTVTETDQGGGTTSIVVTQDGVDDDLGEATSAEFTLLPDEDATVVTSVAVTNAYTVGSIELTKAVTGTGADVWGGTFGDFEVQVVCTLEAADPDTVYDETITLTKDAPGNVAVIENLPTGASCTVTEIDDGGATESTVTPSTFVVGDDTTDEPIAVEIENEFRTGALNVLKTVDGPGVPEFSQGPFIFTVVCTYEGQAVIDQRLVVVGDGTEGPFTSETITGIPVGSVCVVTEVFRADADETPPPVTVTIPDQEPEGVETVVTAGFLNVFSLGEIQVAKEVDGAAAEQPFVQNAVFTVHVTCQLSIAGVPVTVFSGPVEVGAGETVQVLRADGTPLKLPYQTRCFGEEADAAGATASTVDFDSFENAAVIDVEDEPQMLTITATNTFELGSLALTKTVSGDVSQAAGKTFRIEVTCVLEQGANEPYVALDASPVMIAGGETSVIEDLPIGAECWAAEPDPAGAAAVTISATEATPVTVGLDDVVTITVDNRFDPPMPATGVDGAELAAHLTWALGLIGGGLAVIAFVQFRRRRQVG